MYYSKNLVSNLLEISKNSPGCVVANRVHEVTLDRQKKILPYKEWSWNSVDSTSERNFFTSGAGTFFPPNSFNGEVTNEKKFQYLAPSADDVWLNWMVKINNTPIISCKKEFSLWDWPETQKETLHSINVARRENDSQIKNMTRVYGNVYK